MDSFERAPQPHHVVTFSSGLGSYLTALRVAERFPGEPVTLLFSDVKGSNPSPHAGEDDDNYRFLRESAADLASLADVTLVWLRGEEDIWDVFQRERWIGNARVAPCSEHLKQRPARDWLAANCPDPTATTIYIGIDWSEKHRIPKVKAAYEPRPVAFPMTEKPYLDKRGMAEVARGRGIEPPRLYGMGFPHANCGGFCVRSGQAQFALLLRTMPERYAYHEEREQELRDHLGKNVAILRDRNGGSATPLTLRAFRERVEAPAIPGQGQLLDEDEWGGCGCFTATE
jgi:hypothetical protein